MEPRTSRPSKLVRARRIGYQADQLELRLATDGPLQEYQEFDIALDIYPYPGAGRHVMHCTMVFRLLLGRPASWCALWSQYPAECWAWESGGLFAGSICCPGFPSSLAAEPQLLAKLHQVLPQKIEQSMPMDGRGYVQDIEAAYEKVWAVWMRQEN